MDFCLTNKISQFFIKTSGFGLVRGIWMAPLMHVLNT